MFKMESALESARRLKKEAEDEGNAQKAMQAITFYSRAIAEASLPQKKILIPEQSACLELKKKLVLGGSGGRSHGTSGGGGGGGSGGVKEEWVDFMLKEKPNVSWNQVVGLDEAKKTLKEAVILPLKQPQFFKEKRTPYKAVLLYGPSGTGKTYIAKAVATEANATFFTIRPSDVMSKWLGESEQIVRKFWDQARLIASEKNPVVIFIDEVDALFSRRSATEDDSTRRIKNELLTQMDGVHGENKHIVVLGATNLPQSIDEAFIRRFQKRIPINLPDRNARKRMFEIHIGNTPTSLRKPADYNELARRTDGYSGDDIHTVVQTALLMPIHDATHFKQEGEMWLPCSPSESGAEEKEPIDIPDGKLGDPPVTLDHFIAAIEKTPKSVTKGSIEQIQMFAKKQ